MSLARSISITNLWQPKPSPDIAKCPQGSKTAPKRKITALNGLAGVEYVPKHSTDWLWQLTPPQVDASANFPISLVLRAFEISPIWCSYIVTVFVTYISLITAKIGRLSLQLLLVWISSTMNDLFIPFAQFPLASLCLFLIDQSQFSIYSKLEPYRRNTMELQIPLLIF